MSFGVCYRGAGKKVLAIHTIDCAPYILDNLCTFSKASTYFPNEVTRTEGNTPKMKTTSTSPPRQEPGSRNQASEQQSSRHSLPASRRIPVSLSLSEFHPRRTGSGPPSSPGQAHLSGPPSSPGQAHLSGPPSSPGQAHLSGPPSSPGQAHLSGPPSSPGQAHLSGPLPPRDRRTCRAPLPPRDRRTCRAPLPPRDRRTCRAPLPPLDRRTCRAPLPPRDRRTCRAPLPPRDRRTCRAPLPPRDRRTCLAPLPPRDRRTCRAPLPPRDRRTCRAPLPPRDRRTCRAPLPPRDRRTCRAPLPPRDRRTCRAPPSSPLERQPGFRRSAPPMESGLDQVEPQRGDPGPKLSHDLPDESEQKVAPIPAPILSESRLRKFFVLRPGTFEQAMTDIRAQIDQQRDGEIQSSWLLTEVDHWNNEKERIVLITERTLLICKYDFVMLSFQSCCNIPLNYIDKICHGPLAFPEYSISRKEGNALRVHWDKLREAPFLSRWNPWSNEIPYTTFTEHPVAGANQTFNSMCQLENFKGQLAQAVQKAYQLDPVPGRANGVIVLNHPISIETYIGIVSLISNQNKLGYSLARGSVGF
ncbi:putative protein FAM47C [Narcine bancroftii]|uniref:putative protein FAM47C n=1 Tax=Narcine bancroftii TaxID=1343680 RepID=UPI0038312463